MSSYKAEYGKKKWKQWVPCILTFLAFNLYFFFFLQHKYVGYLGYLDILLLVFVLIWLGTDYIQFQKEQEKKQALINQNQLVCRMLSDFENQDIAEHDVQVLEQQLRERFEENCELQDYVAKWCHELKIPLSAGLLINEKNPDAEQKTTMRNQLEKMNQQMNSLLLGCKLQSPLFDLQIKPVWISDCVKTSIRNNQFFLIQHHFSLTVEVEKLTVYTDPAWLTYILDQLMNNAIKYRKRQEEAPGLHLWTEQRENQVSLFVEDYGEGIRKEDLRRIFEKGFVGRNCHNGKYKSTGMGLYMVSKIISRLGHEIYAESEYGEYTRFCLIFNKNPYFFQ